MTKLKYLNYLIFILIIFFSACTPAPETNSSTETPIPSPTDTPAPTPTLPLFNINDYQSPEGAEKVSFKVREGASVTLGELSSVMPWYSHEPYANKEVLKTTLETEGFKINQNDSVTGSGSLYVLPTPAFVAFFREHFELVSIQQLKPLGIQINPIRFENYPPTWSEGYPFEAYINPKQIRLIIPDQRTLENNLLVLDIDITEVFSIAIDGKIIDMETLLKRDGYIGIPLTTIVKEVEFGIFSDPLESNITVFNNGWELSIKLKIETGEKFVSLGNHYSSEQFFLDELEAAIEQLNSVGVNGVSMPVMLFVENLNSNEVYRAPKDWVEEVGSTQSNNVISKFGMITNNFQMNSNISIALLTPRFFDWMGALNPPDMFVLQQSYIDHVVEIAKVAEESGITTMAVVNEVPPFYLDEEFMSKLYEEVKLVYSGELGFNIGFGSPQGFYTDDLYGDFRQVPLEVMEKFDWVGINVFVDGRGDCSDVQLMVPYMVKQMNFVADYYNRVGISNEKLKNMGFGSSKLEGGCLVPAFAPNTDEIDFEGQANYYEAYFLAYQESNLKPTRLNAWSYTLSWCELVENDLSASCSPNSITLNPYIFEVFDEYWNQ